MTHYKNSFRNALMLLLGVAILCTSCKRKSGVTGDCTWTLTGAAGNYTLTIGGRGAMGDYDSLDGSPWFQYRDSIKTAVIRDGVTTVGDRAFWGCSMTFMNIPNSVMTIGTEAFVGCTDLISVSIPNSVITIGHYAFAGCSLTSVSIPNSVTVIGYGAFGACIGLTSVNIPNSVTGIGDEAFAGCSGLTSVSIPNSVTTIGDEAFYKCIGLTSVTIPNSVTGIGDRAFSDCAGLTSVTNLNPTPQNINSNVFFSVSVNISALTLKVPASAVDAYKAAPVWREFGKITAISDEDE
ncbi:MAG: leucine-rich repeat domain-containing protein [Bacteroidales bacterium]|jgi:hypothetical protein|nr:leucine-rich repeat domain-containing protein [Bacteroidales bacterium]